MPIDRPSGRSADQIRAVSLDINVSKHAEGSCLVKFGDTHVLCTASLETRVPCLLYTSPSPRDGLLSRMPSSA